MRIEQKQENIKQMNSKQWTKQTLIKCTNHKKKKNRNSGAEGSKNEMKKFIEEHHPQSEKSRRICETDDISKLSCQRRFKSKQKYLITKH